MRIETPLGHGQHGRREVQDRAHAGRRPAGRRPPGRRAPGVAIMPIVILRSSTMRAELGDGLDRQVAHLLAHEVVVGVDERHDPKAAGAETTVVGEGAAQVSDSDDRDRPVAGEAELPGDLVEEVVDVVADAPRAVRPEVREVLADLGRVHAGQLGQPLRRDRRRPRARRPRAGPGSRAAGGRRSPRGSGVVQCRPLRRFPSGAAGIVRCGPTLLRRMSVCRVPTL